MIGRPTQQRSFLDFINENYLLILAELIETHLTRYSESMHGIRHRRDHNQAVARLRDIHKNVEKKIELTNLEKLTISILHELSTIAAHPDENLDTTLEQIRANINTNFNDELFSHTSQEEIDRLKTLLLDSIQSIQKEAPKQETQKAVTSINRTLFKLKSSRHTELVSLHHKLLESLNAFLNEKHANNEHIEHLKNLLVATLKQYTENVYPYNTYDFGYINLAISNLEMSGYYLSEKDIAFTRKWRLIDNDNDCASNPERFSQWKQFLILAENWSEIKYTSRLALDIENLFGIQSTREYRVDSDLRRQVNKRDTSTPEPTNPQIEQFTTLTGSEIERLIDSDRDSLSPLISRLRTLHRMHNEIIIWTNRNLEIVLTEKAIQAALKQMENPDSTSSPHSYITDTASAYKKILSKVHQVQLHITTECHYINEALVLKQISNSKLPIDAQPFTPVYGLITRAETRLDHHTHEEKLTGRFLHKTKSSLDFADELKKKTENFETLLKSTLGHFSNADQVRIFTHQLADHYSQSDDHGFQFQSGEIEDICNNIDNSELTNHALPAELPSIDWQQQKHFLQRASLNEKEKEEMDEHSEQEDMFLSVSIPRESLSEDLSYAEHVRQQLHHPLQSFGERHPLAKNVLIGIGIGIGVALLATGIAAAIIFSAGGAALAAGAIAAVFGATIVAPILAGATIGACWPEGPTTGEPGASPQQTNNNGYTRIPNEGHENDSDDDLSGQLRLSSSDSRIAAELSKKPARSISTGSMTLTEKASSESAASIKRTSSGSLAQFNIYEAARRKDNALDIKQPIGTTNSRPHSPAL